MLATASGARRLLGALKFLGYDHAMNQNSAHVPSVGVVGDFDPKNPSHRATNLVLSHVGLAHEWIGTEQLVSGQIEPLLSPFSGLLIAPGSPYRNMEGALSAIRLARERGVPLVAT
jgi:CTP synthase (UTP-ammonia lyase)